MMTRALVYVFMIFMVGFASPLLVQQETVQEEKLPAGDNGKRIKMIRKYIGDAGQLYKSADYAKAGKKILAAQSLLERAIANGSEEYRSVIEKEYKRVAKAHKLLSSKSVTLTELKPMPEKLGFDSSMTEEATRYYRLK